MAQAALAPDRVAEVHRLRDEGRSQVEVAARLGMSRTTVAKYWFAPVPAAPEPPPDPLAVAREQADRRRELARQKDVLLAVAGEQSFRSYLEGVLREVAPRLPAPPPYRPVAPARSDTTESLLLLLSDWHAYEEVDPERVLGLNRYGADVFGRRVYQIGRAVASVREKLGRGGWRFPELVVGCNGDFISGTIHEVERHQDAPNVVAAAYGCGMVLAQLLRDLSGQFERVRVFGTSGNHGRLPDHKRVSQKDPTRSWDYLIYLFAREALAGCPNVEVVLPNSYSVVYEVQGWNFYQGHGHDVKSWQNIPFYGISRMATGLNALRVAAGNPIHYFLISHFHNKGSIEAAGGEYFVNGSLIGGTEFSVNGLGRADKPCQWLLGVHPKNGVTHRWPLYADGESGPAYDPRPWAALGAAA